MHTTRFTRGFDCVERMEREIEKINALQFAFLEYIKTKLENSHFVLETDRFCILHLRKPSESVKRYICVVLCKRAPVAGTGALAIILRGAIYFLNCGPKAAQAR